MANTLLTPQVVGRELMLLLENQLVAASLFHRGHTEEFTGAKVGDNITIRGPATFEAQEFSGSVVTQTATESRVTLELEKHFDVTFAVTSRDWTLELAEFSRQLLQPAVAAVAQGIDAYILGKYTEVYHQVGAATDPPDALADLAAVDKQLNEQKVPMGGRFAILNPEAKADMYSISEVVSAEKRGDGGQALRTAEIGEIMNVRWYMDQNVQAHTAGTYSAGSPVVNGAVAEGATSMDIDGGSGSETIKEGDVFTVADVDGEYVFTADATASSGDVTGATFTPAAPSGGFPNDKAITMVASHDANLCGVASGLTVALVPLELPRGAARAEYVGDRGLGLRVVFDYDSQTKTDTISLDVLCGAKVQQPELLTRILG